MDFYRPIRTIFGECVFSVPEREFPRLTNIYSSETLGFRAGKRDPDAGRITFGVSLMAAERAYTLAKNAGVDIETVKKRGLPFVFAGYKKRFGLIAGLFIGLAMLFAAQLFVWRITVTGNETVPDSVIKASLEQCGVKVGSLIPRIDSFAAANELVLNCDPISSAAVTIDGTSVVISVLERTHPPEITDTSGYYNAVAARDGVIVDIDAFDGTPEVSAGEAVYEGQLLINSFIEGNYGTFVPTHARGRVLAEVREHFEVTVPLERSYKRYTGAESEKRVISVLGLDIPLFFDEGSPYEYSDLITSEKDVELFGFVELPVRISSLTYYEYVPEPVTVSPEEAERIAYELLDGWLAELDEEVKECSVITDFDKETGACTLKADAVIITDICREVPLTINDYGRDIKDKLPNGK